MLSLQRIDNDISDPSSYGSETEGGTRLSTQKLFPDSVHYALKLVRSEVREEGGIKGGRKPEAVFILGLHVFRMF